MNFDTYFSFSSWDPLAVFHRVPRFSCSFSSAARGRLSERDDHFAWLEVVLRGRMISLDFLRFPQS